MAPNKNTPYYSIPQSKRRQKSKKEEIQEKAKKEIKKKVKKKIILSILSILIPILPILIVFLIVAFILLFIISYILQECGELPENLLEKVLYWAMCSIKIIIGGINIIYQILKNLLFSAIDYTNQTTEFTNKLAYHNFDFQIPSIAQQLAMNISITGKILGEKILKNSQHILNFITRIF